MIPMQLCEDINNLSTFNSVIRKRLGQEDPECIPYSLWYSVEAMEEFQELANWGICEDINEEFEDLPMVE